MVNATVISLILGFSISAYGATAKTSGGYEVDALISYGDGVNFTKATIDAALAAIGTSNKATLLLRPGTWAINAKADWSAYANVTFKIVPGAMLRLPQGARHPTQYG